MRRFSIIAFVEIACAAEQPHTVTLAHETPQPVATVDASLPQPTAPKRPTGNACLMLYECGCNAGCTQIDQPMAALSPNMRVNITSGPLKGTPAFVARQKTDTGERVLTLQRADPSSPFMICATPRSSTIGYLCSVKDSGSARACETCD